MSLDPKNLGHLTGGLVANPEVNGNVMKLRMAVDYAGNDRVNPDDKNAKTGFFNVTYFLNGDDPNTKFVKGQHEKGNLKQGSQVSIAYRLLHERYETKDGNKGQAVTLIAEALTYAGGSRPEGQGGAEGGGNAGGSRSESQAPVPSEF